jgi:hypothetical protein
LALGGYNAPKLPGGYAPNPASEAVAQGVLTGIGIGLGIEVTASLHTHAMILMPAMTCDSRRTYLSSGASAHD